MIDINKIYCGDWSLMKSWPDRCVNCCVTSPPYFGLRNYGNDAQIGLEETPELYISNMVAVFREVKRVLKNDAALWLNIGDSYSGSNSTKDAAINPNSLSFNMGQKKGGTSKPIGVIKGLKPKDLIGIPWMLAFALRADGWYLRQDIIWAKPNPMPESVTDRCTKSHEYIFLLSKSAKYYYDFEAIQEVATGYDGRKDIVFKEATGGDIYASGKSHNRWKFKNLQYDGQKPNSIHLKRAEDERNEVYPIRNKRSVWTVNTMPYSEAHFATFPEKLIVDCIKAGCPEGGIVLDPFMGAGTTALVARKLNRNFVGTELNQEYVTIAEKRLEKELGMFI